MEKNHKFKYGDIVYIKVYLAFDYELGKIIRFDEEKGMYVMIHFLDNLDPVSFWRWCYVKEEDIEFASKVFGPGEDESYKKYFHCYVKLNKSNYLELYDDGYRLAEEFYEGKISRAEYYRASRELYEKRH